MKFVVALDSFKGTLSAGEACRVVSDVIGTENHHEVIVNPMADGGEGTAAAMMMAKGGQFIPHTVMGPLPEMEIDAGFVWFEDEKIALVEMASASGIELLNQDQLNPLETTTFGTGQLISKAINYGAEQILLAIGGSATVDCGVGAAQALGWGFNDSKGSAVDLGGKALVDIAQIVKPQNNFIPPLKVLCDVDNALCGKNGAARVYGPQKGASPEMVEFLEDGLENISDVIFKQLGIQVANIPGSGAAGGLASGAIAFMNASLESGVDTIIDQTNLESKLSDADWVITGEGCFDEQSLRGKVVSGITKIASKTNTRVAVLAGQVKIEKEIYTKHGITVAIPCKEPDMSMEYVLNNPCELLKNATNKLLSSCVF